MINAPRHSRRSARPGLVLLAACIAVLFAAAAARAADPVSVPPTDEPQREIFVPFADLHVILSADIQRVFVTREEYEALAAKAKQASRPDEPKQPAAVLSADYVATIEENRARLVGTLVVAAPDDSLSAVDLDLSGVALRSATLDDKPAALGRNPAGWPVLFVSGAGRHELKLEILAPVETAAAQRTLSFQIPTPPATRIKLIVPGYVEIKSGATVIRHDVDPRQGTTFDLLPRRGQNSLVLSLNNRQLRKERVVVAHAVLIDEITTAYERLHVTASLSVLHGAADQFRFALPNGFEVTSVSAPQVARWAVTTEDGQRILDVRLREAITDTVSLNIAAIRSPVSLEEWRLPKLAALDVAGQAAVVGLLLDNRLKPYDLRPKNLISIDSSVLSQTLPASWLESRADAPPVAAVAAFYAPRGDYDLQARFAAPPTELRVTSNVLLTLTDAKLEARGGFALLNVTDKLLGFDFSSPAGWQVTELTLDGGAALPLETYPAADGSARVHVRLPQAAPLGQSRNVYFRAVNVPDGWLDDWSARRVEFPVFQVAGAARDAGAIAVQSQDDMLARAERVTRLTPLDANEKSNYGLEKVTTQFAYRYDAPPYGLTLALARVKPRLTARAFSFFRAEPDLLTAHYEIAYDVTEARTSRLAFSLPQSTPAELAIRGLDGVAIKESSSALVGKERQWTVLLGESRRGAIRLAVDFQQPLGDREKKAPGKGSEKDAPAPAEVTLPLVRALEVAYQSGTVAVEGSSESDMQVKTSLRKVDVGLLAEADYQPGRRLLGAFGYGGNEAEAKLAIARPPGYELPTVIVERAELLTMVSTSGRSQTAVRFQLRSKALLIEVRLPEGSTLWSAYLDGQPTLPEREANSLLIGLPAKAEAGRRDLQLVYETPVNMLGMASRLDLAAPKLLLRANRGAAGDEVPLADLVWQLSTPDGFKVVRSNGTVFSRDIAIRESPLARVAEAVSDEFSSMQGARESGGQGLHSYGFNSESSSGAVKSAAPAPERPSSPNSGDMAKDSGKEDREEDLFAEAKPKSEAKADQAAKKVVGKFQEMLAEEEEADVKVIDAIVTSPSAAAKQSLWALEGVRSLPIEFQPDQIQTTFQSLGEEPRLSVTVVDRTRFDLLGWCVGLLVFLRGVMLTGQPRRQRLGFVAVVLVASFALPLVVPWTGVIAPLCNMAFYAACWLVAYYLAAGIVKRIMRFGRGMNKYVRDALSVAAVLGLLMLLARTAPAEEPLVPVKVPPDAIIIPYDPDKQQDPLAAIEAQLGEAKTNGEKDRGKVFGADKSQKLLVPYEKYLKLLRSAHPEDKVKPVPPAEYALAGGQLTTRLDGGESLLVEGRLDVDVLVDHVVSIPLSLAGGVLTKVEVDGKPGAVATLQQPGAPHRPNEAVNQPAHPQPAAAPLALLVSGPGRRRVELAMRFGLQRRGGWQIAEGRLPVPPAAALTLEVAKAGTEVTLSGGVDHGNFETKRDNETVETALAADGAFRVQWRAKAGPAPVDQSLAVRGAALLDVQEDGLRLIWRLDLEFRRGQRESFIVDVPEGYLVEKVTGGNVRGWRLDEAGGRRKLEVTLLKAAQDTESFSVALSRRGAVGSGELAEFTAPVLSVEGAAQQSGELTIRRSPLLELRTERASGAARADGGAAQAGANAESEESPLGILPFQVYRFATTPFTVTLSARPVAPRVSAELQTVLKISERQRTLESRIRIRVDERPIYRLRIALPKDWRLDRVSAPEPFEWVVGQDGPRRLLSLYFASGQRQSFDVVLAGTLGEYGAAETVAAPNLEVVDADEQAGSIEQTGDIVIQADPSLNVRAEKLVHCETELLARVNAWLNPAQRPLARLALRYRSPDYAAQLQLSPRKPNVHCDTFSNIRVNERTVEETILLDFNIREAGIRSLSFVLPESLRDARISAPMLREKTVEPMGDGAKDRVRVRLELQEEVMDSLRVLVESDRLLSSEKYAAPIPVVETGETDHRYITLESAGRDEIVVDAREGVDPVGQEQAEWQMLTALLGRGLTQAYLVRPAAAQPLLTLRAQDRAAVETAGARIGLAKATLVIDANGAYRGAQLYRVDNSLEQYLEVQLPTGARLWTAHVAGEPVKPAAGKAAGTAVGTAEGIVRIPLVKTAPGDADYPVILKYGGQLGRLEVVDRLEFPLIHTLNIHVELSQVELYLPETHDWFNFGGTMRLVQTEGDLAAGWLAYNTKQIGLAMQALRSEDPFARARATNNLKALQAESEALKQSARTYDDNPEFSRQLKANWSIQKGLEIDVSDSANQSQVTEELDNRGRLSTIYKSQSNTRAGEIVNQAGENFALPTAQAPPQVEGQGQAISRRWLAENKLENAQAQPTVTSGGGVAPQQLGASLGTGTYGGGTTIAPPAGVSRAPSQPAAPKAAFSFQEPQAANSNPVEQPQEPESSGRKAQRQLNRYNERLARQQEQQAPQQYLLDSSDDLGAPVVQDSATGTKQVELTFQGAPKDKYSPAQGPAGGGGGVRGTVQQGGQPQPPIVLASLDVELHPHGAKYLFTTPRGDAEVTARAVSGSLVGRLVRLAGLAVGLLALVAAMRRWPAAFGSRPASAR
jgi:hypothetical protein